MSKRRLYRTRIGRIGVYIIAYPGFLLLFSLLVVAPISILLRITVGALIVLNWWGTRRASQIGMEVSQHSDIVIRRGFFHIDRLRWEDVDHLEVHRRGASMEVNLMLSDGRMIHSTLLQGRVVTWSGGKTKDILSVLQAELDTHRASRQHLSARLGREQQSSRISGALEEQPYSEA